MGDLNILARTNLQRFFHLSVAFVMMSLAGFSLFIDGFWVITLGCLNFVLFTYTNLLWLLPRFLLRRKYLAYTLGLVSISFVSGYLGFGVWVKPALEVLQIVVLVLTGIFLQLIPVTLALLFLENKSRRKMAELEQLQAQQELHYLKLQLNPHFLFNTLNSLYSLTLTKDDLAPEAVARLAGLMRYLLETDQVKLSPLEQEIAYLCNYIELEKIRRHGLSLVNFIKQGDLAGATIPPGLLFPLVENAFKYAGGTHGEAPFIGITLTLQFGELFFEVANSKEMKGQVIFSSGTGLQNLQRRLNLLYPGRYELKISEDNTVYKALLWIKL